VLAAAYGKLGQQEEARTWYGKAVQWMEKNAAQDEMLRRFRAEAAQEQFSRLCKKTRAETPRPAIPRWYDPPGRNTPERHAVASVPL
jgi:hypothetical protein